MYTTIKRERLSIGKELIKEKRYFKADFALILTFSLELTLCCPWSSNLNDSYYHSTHFFWAQDVMNMLLGSAASYSPGSKFYCTVTPVCMSWSYIISGHLMTGENQCRTRKKHRAIWWWNQMEVCHDVQGCTSLHTMVTAHPNTGEFSSALILKNIWICI